MKPQGFLITLLLALAPIGIFWGCADNADARTEIIPLDMTGPRPAVAISINGQAPALWTFDTGAGGSVIDMDLAHTLSLPEGQQVQLGSPAGGTPMQGYVTTLSGARAGAVALPAFRVVAAPPMIGDRVGVLSPNAFRGRFVTLDVANAQLRIEDARPAGEATPYLGERGAGPHALPAIAVTIGAQTQMAHIDSGAPGGLTLPYAMAASLPLTAAPVEAGHARFVDGVHTRYHATIQGVVQVGPLTLTNPEIDLIEGLPFVNIGTRLLDRMTVTLDPAQQVSWTSANGR